MRQWLRKLVQGLVLGALLALLFLYPQAAMQGVREGLSLWANAVLPALLPFFVLTSLLLEGGMLRLLAPLAAPLCRLFRIPREAGGVLLSGWLSGAPNGARLAASLAKRGDLTGPEASRLLSAATVTSPLFLVGTVGQALGSPALGLLDDGVVADHLLELLLRVGDDLLRLALGVGEDLLAVAHDDLRVLDVVREGDAQFADDVQALFHIDQALARQRHGRRLAQLLVQIFQKSHYVHFSFSFRGFFCASAESTGAGTSAETSPPSAWISRTREELMYPCSGFASRNSVSISGAM